MSLALIAGSERNVRPRKLRSRGLARPVVTRASNRSTSYTRRRLSCRSSHNDWSPTSSSTASNRARITAASQSGLATHSASSREPIAVTVRSSTQSSEPSRRPSRMVRVISRLRRLDSSISSVPELRYGSSRSMCAKRAFLRFGEIVEDGPGGTDRLGVGRTVAETETFQARRGKMLGQHLPGGLLRKRPTSGDG